MVMSNHARSLTRRKFLGLAGTAAAGLALFGCAPEQVPQPIANPERGLPQKLSQDAAEEASPEVPQDVPEASQEAQQYVYQEESGAGAQRVSVPVDQYVSELMARMSEHEKLCQLFVMRPETLTGVDTVTQAGNTTRQALAQNPIGGIAYFGKNLLNASQTSSMLRSTYDYSMAVNGIPPLLCVDEEGGTVARVGGRSGFSARNVGNMSDIGATGNPARAGEVARYIGNYLTPLGFNVDFAPVCDVANNPDSDTMRYRSFGADPGLVGQMVSAQVRGFLETGILCCAKHFPGIGAAVGDSHDARIMYHGTLAQLEATELVPFRAAIGAGVPMVMVGHMSLPAIVGDDTPACLSSSIVTGILRGNLGFSGVVVTDSLGMGAVLNYYSTGDAAVRAIQAGCDILLMPADFPAALDGLRGALADGRLNWARIDESLRRILRMKVAYFFG